MRLLRNWKVDWDIWSLYRRVDKLNPYWDAVFSLRCVACRCWTWGCEKHWWCGMCEQCHYMFEPWDSEDDKDWGDAA